MEDFRMTEATSPQKVSVFGWCLRNPVEIVAALLIFVLTIMVFLQVLYRYVLHSPLAWSEEFAMFLFQWCIFIGAALAIRHGYHFHVDLVTSRLSGNWKAAIQMLSSAIIFVVAYTMIHMGIKMVLTQRIRLPDAPDSRIVCVSGISCERNPHLHIPGSDSGARDKGPGEGVTV